MASSSLKNETITKKSLRVLGLGRLVDLIVRNEKGIRQRVLLRSERWLAWKADTRELIVLIPLHAYKKVDVRDKEYRQHTLFHGAVPHKTQSMQWPQPEGDVKTLGLIESVTYRATGIQSPAKGPHYWIHQFGDRGQHGHDSVPDTVPKTLPKAQESPYPESSMPRLDVDEDGNLFITRRSGNKYSVRDWIIG